MELSLQEARILKALFVNYVEDDADSAATAETAGCTIDSVLDLMRRCFGEIDA